MLIVTLIIACLAVAISISFFAAKGKLHMPAYVGIAFLAFVFSMVFGELAGIKGIRGSAIALALSIAFYLCISTTVGSIVALLFYRRSREV
jgi:hypothetical protein